MSDKKDLVPLETYSPPELTKEKYLSNLNQDLNQYNDIELSREEIGRINRHLAKLSTGTTAMVPLYCAGDRCPFKDRCPLYAMDKAPVGRQCLIENQLMKEFTVRYFEEFDVDPTNWTEVAYVNELAEIDIYLTRLSMIIARPENSELVIDQVTAIAQDGTPILQKQIAPYMELRDRLLGRRSRVVKLMVGDRQEKYKKEAALKVKLDTDPSSKMAAMRAKLEELNRAMGELSSTSSTGKSEASQDQSILTPENIIDSLDDE